MQKVTLDRTWSILLGEPLGDLNYWVDKKKIPLGTLKPFEMYDGGVVPEEDIVTIDFDDVETSSTSRKALNMLILGGSGDGKSLLMKTIWSVLHESGYYCGYIDPKSTDSGRARSGWKSNRLPPHMDAKGIDLQHFMPVWSLQNFEHLAHNFRHYSTRLSKISEREMWQGLGMTNIGASKTAKIIKRYINEFGDISMSDLKEEIFNLSKEDLPSGSADAVIRVLTDMEDYEVVDDGVPELKLWNEWKKGCSVCISYNSASRILMTFDIGMKIRESARLYFQGNRNPVMWFFDDASYYAKEMKVVPFNFAVQEIKEIGFNYRSLGVYNVLAVQSLGIIDENVAETYKIKIISPLFQSVDQLSSINVPKKAIDYLRNNILVKDRKRYLMQFLLIDEDQNTIPFFPFTPPCEHFKEVYFEKKKEEFEGDSNA